MGNFSGVVTLGYVLKDLFLPLGQLMAGLGLSSFFAAHMMAYKVLGNHGAQIRLSRGHGPNRGDKLLGWAGFADISLGSGFKYGVYEMAFPVHGQAKDLDIGVLGFDLAGSHDTVYIPHADIHNDHVREQLLGFADGLLSITSLANNFYIGLLP
jgi:hypothetical protein